MPNWCSATLEVVLPKENKKDFLRHFIDDSESYTDTDLSCHLARTFLDYVEEKEYTRDPQYVWLSIHCNCAWSVTSCWDSGYPQENAEWITMSSVCKKLNIKLLAGKSIEMGVGFAEYFEYNPTDGFSVESRELHRVDYLYEDCNGDIELWENNFDDGGSE